MEDKVILETEFMLTTTDNPFNPFEDFHSWFYFDITKGYNCCGYLDRIAKIEDDMTQKELNAEIERAIDEIIEYNPLGIYQKVSRQVPVEEYDMA